MLFRGFGRLIRDEEGKVLIRQPVEESLKLFDGVSLEPINLRLALQEQYETYYGIYNHDDPHAPPLSIVTFHDKERHLPYTRYRRLVSNYIRYGIREIFGLSLTEFLQLPRAEIELLLEEALSVKKRKEQMDERITKKMSQAWEE